ncbi:phosphoribosylglycinamide synthetase, partial [Staphylococcus aureus]
YKYARQIYKIIVHVQYRYNYEKDIYEYLKYDIIKRLCFEKGGTLNV